MIDPSVLSIGALASPPPADARVVSWFSCGAASAVAAKLAVQHYGDRAVVAYCDTSADEHPDNLRFMRDVEAWLGRPVHRVRSTEYRTLADVFMQTRYMAGLRGARCTTELKKLPRFAFQRATDVHIFGFTADTSERRRIEKFTKNNPDLVCDWILARHGITKDDCHAILIGAGIPSPAMYGLGYVNNNCIGCVKATSFAYWRMIRRDFPEVFAVRSAQSRELGARLVRVKGVRVFLDEMPYNVDGEGDEQEDIACGPECQGLQNATGEAP